ncbi:MAG: nitroreductase family protein [Planctomycetia bacterium]|nr:nitroreductase family protein [Planctomycetia bacterium]
MLCDYVLKNRSYRRFEEERQISTRVLENLVDLARICPSAANLQRLKWGIVNVPELCEKVFACVGWAGYLQDWPGPEKGERPAAYLVLLRDLSLGATVSALDEGIVAQTVLLGAVEEGLGGCMIGTVRREQVLELLGLDSRRFEISLVIALGYPKETVVLEEMVGNDCRYWRDENQVHHVPKRSLEEIIVFGKEKSAHDS